MHDGSVVRFRRVGVGLRSRAIATPRTRTCASIRRAGEVVTGLLYIDESAADMHGVSGTVERPLVEIPYEELCPGSAALAELMDEYR